MLGYGALAAALVLFFADGSAAGIALALLAATASVEAMAAFARTAFRQASVDESLGRLSALAALPPLPSAPLSAVVAPAAITLGPAHFPPGARLAITGISGSGKTRLIEGLTGIRPAIHTLLVDGLAVPACTADQLRQQFALSPQDAVLIAGTIADNLRLARPRVTADQMHAALVVAGLDDRIAAMPDGLETRMGEDGGTLSGGERKRLSLARALLAERPWLVLDEPTEGLDAASEAALIARLGAWLDRTATGLILVSHRPAPLALAQSRIAIATIARSGR